MTLTAAILWAELETCYSIHDNVIIYVNAGDRANSSDP